MTPDILIVVHGYPPTAPGGAENRAARTAIGLSRRGLDVRVLAFEAHGDAALAWEDARQDGVLVRRLTGGLARGQDPFQASYDNFAVAEALKATLAEWRPHLVHLFSGYLMSAAAVRMVFEAGTPVVVSLTDYWWFCHRVNLLRPDGRRCEGPSPAGCARCYRERRRRWRVPAALWPAAADWFWKTAPGIPALRTRLGLDAAVGRASTVLAALRQASALVAPSRYLAEFYVRNGVEPNMIHVIRQGVDLAHCPLRVRAEGLRVGYLGQVKAHKGVALLLEAWSVLKGARPRSLTLYGSAVGEEAFARSVRQMISHLPHTEWRGLFAASKVWDVLAGLDVVVIPSRWVENSPNVILEAQAMGIPVVGSNIGGIAELVEHERNGLLFETDSASDLARQLQRLLDEPDLAGRLARGALPFRTTDDELDDLIRLFDQCLPG